MTEPRWGMGRTSCVPTMGRDSGSGLQCGARPDDDSLGVTQTVLACRGSGAPDSGTGGGNETRLRSVEEGTPSAFRSQTCPPGFTWHVPCTGARRIFTSDLPVSHTVPFRGQCQWSRRTRVSGRRLTRPGGSGGVTGSPGERVSVQGHGLGVDAGAVGVSGVLGGLRRGREGESGSTPVHHKWVPDA